jgi:membrane protein DedA with SNARE-associated domain
MPGAHHFLIHKLSYAGTALLLAGSGTLVPLPEEVVLLIAGYLSAQGFMQPLIAIPLAIASLLAGDSVLFALAKAGSPYAKGFRERLQRFNLKRTWVFSPEHPLRAVFALRFVTGLRFLSPVYAGFHGASWAGFLGTTIGALAIFVPVVFGIGYYFNESLARLLYGFEAYRHALFALLLVLVAAATALAAYHYARRGDGDA